LHHHRHLFLCRGGGLARLHRALLLPDGRRAAERARGVSPKPPVDARDVEPVAAPGQEAARLPVAYLREAHRALHRRRGGAAIVRSGSAAAHDEHRQCRDVLLPQRSRLETAGIGGGGGGGGGGHHVLRPRGHGELVQAPEAHREEAREAEPHQHRVQVEPEVAVQRRRRRRLH